MLKHLWLSCLFLSKISNLIVLIPSQNEQKVINSITSVSDAPMFSFQKFYVNGTTATNITPPVGVFGKISLSIVFSDSWGTYNPPRLDYDFPMPDIYFYEGGWSKYYPSFEIWIEGRSRPWDPVIESTWNGQVWVTPDDGIPIGWTTNDYNKWGIIHCAWDDGHKPFEEWPKLSEIH